MNKNTVPLFLQSEEKTVVDLVFDLDAELGHVSAKCISLDDINSLMGQLRVDMDNVKEEELRIYFNEFHRKVRVLDELIRHTSKELNDIYNCLEIIKEGLLDKTVRDK